MKFSPHILKTAENKIKNLWGREWTSHERLSSLTAVKSGSDKGARISRASRTARFTTKPLPPPPLPPSVRISRSYILSFIAIFLTETRHPFPLTAETRASTLSDDAKTTLPPCLHSPHTHLSMLLRRRGQKFFFVNDSRKSSTRKPLVIKRHGDGDLSRIEAISREVNFHK